MKISHIDVDITLANGQIQPLRAWLYTPDQPQTDIIYFCLPGGGMSHRYFDLGRVDNADYSFASHMTKYGHRVISMDHPGIGENTLSAPHPFLTPRQASDYVAKALNAVLETKNWTTNRMIGVGHSMGGMMVTLVQARHKPFSAMVLLGASARGLEWGLSDVEKSYINAPEKLERDLETLTLAKFGEAFPVLADGPRGESTPFSGARPALTEKLRALNVNLFAAGGMMSIVQGSFAKEAGAIAIPLFMCFGDHDIGAPPKEAVLDFTAALSLTLHVLENCGHNSFAFPAITELCARIETWINQTFI